MREMYRPLLERVSKISQEMGKTLRLHPSKESPPFGVFEGTQVSHLVVAQKKTEVKMLQTPT